MILRQNVQSANVKDFLTIEKHPEGLGTVQMGVYRLGCETAGVFAGIAAVIANLPPPERLPQGANRHARSAQ